MKKINVCFLVSGLLLALLLTSCGGGGTGILSKTPSDVIKSSINDLKNKNYKGIIKYYIRKDGVAFTKEDTLKMTGLCTMAGNELEKKQGLKDVQILEEKISTDGKTATVKYKMQYNNGKEDNQEATLNKVNGNWLIIIGN
jgi:hypothetical protein